MDHTTFDEKTKLWHGRQILPLYSPNVSIGQVVLDLLSKSPTKLAQINDYTGTKLTNDDIRIASIRVAQNLKKMGFTKDKVLGFYARNYDEIAAITFGCWTTGVILNPINPVYLKDEVAHIFAITKPSLVVCEQENVLILKESLKELEMDIPIYIFGDPLDDTMKSVNELLLPTGSENDFIFPYIGDATKQISIIHCSSGTTGFPKAVCLSHAAFLTNNGFHICNGDDVVLNFSPLYWVTGTMILLGATLVGATRIITTSLFTPELMLSLVEKYKVTLINSPPSGMAQILDHPKLETTDFSTLRIYLCGGSYVHPSLCLRMKSYMPQGQVHIMYGMSEASGITHRSVSESALGSVGRNTNLHVTKIVDEAGNKCDIGIEGEICIKAYYPFLGYYNDDEETKQIFDHEGFIKTGDIGMYDEHGDLFVCDRKKDIIKYKNQQISPSEIEDVILNHPGVSGVCVTAIGDLACGDLPTALIVKRDNTTVTENDIYALVQDKLSDPKQLRGGVYFVNSLPFTESGKPLRRKAKEMAMKLHEAKLT